MKKTMAEIIDLDFYRRFRVALPIRPEAFEEGKPHVSARPQSRRFRRKGFFGRRSLEGRHQHAQRPEE